MVRSGLDAEWYRDVFDISGLNSGGGHSLCRPVTLSWELCQRQRFGVCQQIYNWSHRSWHRSPWCFLRGLHREQGVEGPGWDSSSPKLNCWEKRRSRCKRLGRVANKSASMETKVWDYLHKACGRFEWMQVLSTKQHPMLPGIKCLGFSTLDTATDQMMLPLNSQASC